MYFFPFLICGSFYPSFICDTFFSSFVHTFICACFAFVCSFICDYSIVYSFKFVVFSPLSSVFHSFIGRSVLPSLTCLFILLIVDSFISILCFIHLSFLHSSPTHLITIAHNLPRIDKNNPWYLPDRSAIAWFPGTVIKKTPGKQSLFYH